MVKVRKGGLQLKYLFNEKHIASLNEAGLQNLLVLSEIHIATRDMQALCVLHEIGSIGENLKLAQGLFSWPTSCITSHRQAGAFHMWDFVYLCHARQACGFATVIMC